jgi:hypothetical protein
MIGLGSPTGILDSSTGIVVIAWLPSGCMGRTQPYVLSLWLKPQIN